MNAQMEFFLRQAIDEKLFKQYNPEKCKKTIEKVKRLSLKACEQTNGREGIHPTTLLRALELATTT